MTELNTAHKNNLTDRHGRRLNYLRLAVTDRCNLRCFYCMPEQGIDFTPRRNLLTYEEMLRLVKITAGLGVNRVRITGGEPFVRKDMPAFLRKLAATKGVDTLNLTTNGTLTADFVSEFRSMGIASVNLSLDALDRDRFFDITRRDLFDEVMRTLEQLLRHDIPTKINAVVMPGRNIEDLVPLAKLAENQPITVRFIEEMPFNGEGREQAKYIWHQQKIEQHLRAHLPAIQTLPMQPTATAREYQVQGFQGKIGIIAAFTRSFCGTCNRLRITPQGLLKTCLYDAGVFNLRDFLRAGATDAQITDSLREAAAGKAKDGFAAEARRGKIFESMADIGG